MTPTTFAGRRSVPARAAAFGTALCVGLGLTTLTAAPAFAADPTPISAVQGTGASTPLAGQTVTVEGVVTADHRTGGYSGVYLQSLAPDADPATSEAVFVFLGSRAATTALAVGDRIQVTGVAGEFNGLTQISASAASAVVTVLESGVALPAPAPLPADPAVREAHEGMLVAPQGDWLVASSHQLFNFGSLWLNPGGLDVKSTELFDAAAPESAALAAQNRSERLLLDDGFSIQVTNGAHPGTQPYFTTGQVVRNGDAVGFPAQGMVLGWGFDDWRLQPQLPASSTQNPTGVTFEARNPRPAAAPETGGDIRVAAYNVLNYFTTLTSQNSQARGASTAAQLAIQESKIVAAINGLDADVVALQEIENSVKLGEATDEALQSLVAALNAEAGAGTWDYVRTPAPLVDASIVDFITNAIIFKPASVATVGESFTQIDETVWDIAREPIAQTFQADGLEFTVVANHFKSKGSGVDAGDGQGASNVDRIEQAEALKGFVEEIEGEAGENVLLLGDFNAYSEEDPIQVLTDASWSDLVADRTDDQYTYTFDGELGSLDHALASPGIDEYVTGVGVWTINSPEWSDRQYAFGATEAGTVFRSSDHDPVVVGLSTTPEPVEIDIVTINDFHGRLEAAPPAAGAAVLGGLVDQVRAQNENTLFVSAGDSVGASTFTSFIQNDEPTIDALNAMGLDVTAIGNHEFDQGRDDLDGRIIPNSAFPYLAANVYEAGTTEPAYDEYFIADVDGVRVGFIGALTQDMPELVSPAGIASLEFGDIAEATNRVAAQLSDGDEANDEADVVILLVHEGAASPEISAATDASVFGDIVNGVNSGGDVDAIVSSHTHFRYDHEIPIPGTDRIMPVIQGGQYGEAYGKLDLTVDPTTKELLSIEAAVAPLVGAAQPNAAVAQIVADAVAFANVAGNERLGSIATDIRRAVTSTGSENRGGESALGNLIADAQLEATQDLGTDIAIMNPGGIRADLVFASSGAVDPDGTVTFREAANVQPFANTLVTMELTGAQLRQVLEEQWQPAGAARPFLKLGLSESLDYTYDPAAAAGSRIGTMLLDGEVITATQVVRIVTNSFLSTGGDNFLTLAQGANRSDSGRIDLQAFVDYFEANSPVELDPAQRAVGISLTPADADGYSAGDQVTATLSSLLFSNAGDRDAEVVLSIGGVEVGRTVIDPAIVNGTDEQGRATITFTVPDGVYGVQQLVVSVPDNGTEAVQSITLADEVIELEPIEVVRQPSIQGGPVVGQTLRTDGGRYSVQAELAYQWLRDGEPIAGATAATYRVTAADAGAALSVRVVASAEGFESATAESRERTVTAAASVTVGWTDRLLISRSGSVTYTVQVAAAGVEPTGTVTVMDGRRAVGTIVLEEGDNGRGSVTIRGLGRGVHLLRAEFAGTEAVRGSTALLPIPVLVF